MPYSPLTFYPTYPESLEWGYDTNENQWHYGFKGFYIFSAAISDTEGDEIRLTNSSIINGIGIDISIYCSEGQWDVFANINGVLTQIPYNEVSGYYEYYYSGLLSAITEFVFIRNVDNEGNYNLFILDIVYAEIVGESGQGSGSRVWTSYINTTETFTVSSEETFQASIFPDLSYGQWPELNDALFQYIITPDNVYFQEPPDDNIFIFSYNLVSVFYSGELFQHINSMLEEYTTLTIVIVWAFNGVAPSSVADTIGILPIVHDYSGISGDNIINLQSGHVYDDTYIYSYTQFTKDNVEDDVLINDIYLAFEVVNANYTSYPGTIYDIRMYTGTSFPGASPIPAGFLSSMQVNNPIAYNPIMNWGG
jgi:hypothetical protein